MRIVIIGAGEVGAYLAQFLVEEHHDVTLIDSDSEKIDRISDHLDLKTHVGSGNSAATLEQAETPGADLLLAMSNSEEVNMLSAYFGKCMGVKRVIARMESEDAFTGHPRFYRQHLGLDLVINPSMLAAAEATTIIQAGCGSGIVEFGFGRVYFRPFDVQPNSPYTKKPISGLKMPGALVVAIIRDGVVMVPDGDSCIQEGDRLVVICKREAVQYIQKGVGETKDKVRRIIIVGGGEVGFSLAQYFDSPRYNVKLFEEDRKRAWELADQLQHVKVIEGDGTDLETLEEEYVDAAEALVAATGSDEKNLMTAVLAKNHGVSRTIAVIDRPQNIELGKKLGVTATLAPRILAANQVLAFIRGGNVNRVSLIAEGQAEVVEFQATETCRLIDKPLMNLGLPKGIIVGAIIRDTKAIIPKGSDQIEPGDAVIMFALAERVPYLESILRKNEASPVDELADEEEE